MVFLSFFKPHGCLYLAIIQQQGLVVCLKREAGHWGSRLVSANTDENCELELLVVKRSVLSVWGEKRDMKRNELFSVPREHLGKAGSSQHGCEVTEQ